MGPLWRFVNAVLNSAEIFERKLVFNHRNDHDSSRPSHTTSKERIVGSQRRKAKIAVTQTTAKTPIYCRVSIKKPFQAACRSTRKPPDALAPFDRCSTSCLQEGREAFVIPRPLREIAMPTAACSAQTNLLAVSHKNGRAVVTEGDVAVVFQLALVPTRNIAFLFTIRTCDLSLL